MKMFLLLPILLMPLASLLPPNAQAANEDVNWAYTYDAKTMPDDAEADPLWSKPIESIHADTASYLEDGKLIIDSGTTVADALVYRLAGGLSKPWSPNENGSTVEVKMQVISGLRGGDGATQSLVIADGQHNYRLRFSDKGLILSDAKFIAIDTSSEARVYRLTIDGSGTTEVFVDGELLTQLEGTPTDQKYLDFGDGTHGEGGKCAWSFVRWTNAGAYHP